MIVDEEALLLGESELRDETRDSQLLEDLSNVEFLVEALLGAGLEGVRGDGLIPAAAAPGAGEVLLAEEVPHIVLERQTALLDLRLEVLLEGADICRGFLIGTHLIFLLVLDMVVQLLSHGVIEREFLVSTEEVACETKDKGEVRTESLESVRDGLTSGVNGNSLAVLGELHVEVSVLGVKLILICWAF